MEQVLKKHIIVIGGGASGMMAAYSAASNGADVTLLEKNEKLGKKIYITGKGRCNFTNIADKSEFFENVVNNSKFLYSAISRFGSDETIDFFKTFGVDSKVERGGRVFPQSDKASDLIKAFARALDSVGVDVRLNARVSEICVENFDESKVEGCGVCGSIVGCKDGKEDKSSTPKAKVVGCVVDGEFLPCDGLIVATGGMSYPTTGSTGDGYSFAKKCGHDIITPRPALTHLECIHEITEGLALKNVRVRVLRRSREERKGSKESTMIDRCEGGSNAVTEIASEFGELLFTKTGVSGPCVLSLSSKVNRHNLNGLILSIDLKPALDKEQLDERILRDFHEFSNRNFENSLGALLPSSLIGEVVSRTQIPKDKKVNQLTATERGTLVRVLKNLDFKLTGIGDFTHAIITSGGVDVRGITANSMESRNISGLFFVGEVLDVDGYTGGFNLQIAFSTGYLAGCRCV